MREIIHLERGISSLGEFMVAMSDIGLVALEFSSRRSTPESALRAASPRPMTSTASRD
jgi:AraC family transcriptional regulator of adaptative response/methylated-DNA-[protein]-cysteine methyltransferase